MPTPTPPGKTPPRGPQGPPRAFSRPTAADIYSPAEVAALRAALAALGRPAYWPGPNGDFMAAKTNPAIQGRGRAFDALKAHLEAQGA